MIPYESSVEHHLLINFIATFRQSFLFPFSFFFFNSLALKKKKKGFSSKILLVFFNFTSQIDVMGRIANSSNTMIKLFIPRRIQDKSSELISTLVTVILELKHS